jgi:heat shock protein HslJ
MAQAHSNIGFGQVLATRAALVAFIGLAAAVVPAHAAPAADARRAPLMRTAPAPINLALRNTEWRLATLDGTNVAAPAGARVPTLVLRSSDQHLAGHTGCAALRGRFTQQGTRVVFRVSPSSAPKGKKAPACEAATAQQANRLLAALAATTSYRVEGQRLSLLRRDEVQATFVSPKR